VRLGKNNRRATRAGWRSMISRWSTPAKGAPVLRLWSDGKLVRGPEEEPGLSPIGAQDFPNAKLDLGADFTAMGKIRDDWQRDVVCEMARRSANGCRTRKRSSSATAGLVYDIGWLGAMTGGGKVDDGHPHTAVLMVRGGKARPSGSMGRWAAEKSGLHPAGCSRPCLQDRAAPQRTSREITAKGKIASVRVVVARLAGRGGRVAFQGQRLGCETPRIFTHVPESGQQSAGHRTGGPA